MKFLKELPIFMIMAVPSLYLLSIWDKIPDRVAMHSNFKGEVDRYGDKTELWGIAIGLPLLMYVVFTFIPMLDKKSKQNLSTQKFQNMRFWTISIITGFSIFLIHHSINSVEVFKWNSAFLFGLLWLVMGNYLPTLKPNKFFGIRTKWTYKSEYVWKKTHRLGGQIMIVCGLVLLCIGFINPSNGVYYFLFSCIIQIFFPMFYSYWIYKKEKNENVPIK